MPDIDRRHLLFAAGASAAPLIAAEPARASGALLALGVDAGQFGVRPGAAGDQSAPLQRAIDETARQRLPLLLPPGIYRAANLILPPHAKIGGVRGASRIVLTYGASLINGTKADNIELSGLVFDGAGKKLPENRGLLNFTQCQGLRIGDCEVANSGGSGIVVEKSGGAITCNTVTATADAAIHSLDATGLTISGNTVRNSGNNGIRVWTSAPAYDGTLVLSNVVEDTRADKGGDGPYGNAINVFRAGNVVVQGNRIRNAAFTAIRGNSASNLQIIGNNCVNLGEVAIYSEFSFEGAVIAQNVIDTAANGISVTNFNVGGRLAVVQGNLIRNIKTAVPYEGQGVGILVDADASVTGNVIENATSCGLSLGFGPFLRDLVVTGNVIRSAGMGMGVSVVPGAGSALIANNLISGATRGAILGMEWRKVVTGDLAKGGAARYAQLSIDGNRVQ